MRSIHLFIVYLLCVFILVTFVDSVVVNTGVLFVYSSTNSTYDFEEQQTFTLTTRDTKSIETGHFVFGTIGVSVYCNDTVSNSINVTINDYSSTLMNFTVSYTSECNNTVVHFGPITVNRTYTTTVDGMSVGITTANSTGYLLYTNSTSQSTSTTYAFSSVLICTGLQYSLWNSTDYVYDYNQTPSFYCFPYHDNCTPSYQNSTQWLLNWTNTLGSVQTVYMITNSSTRGYTLSMTNSSDIDDEVTLSTTRAEICTTPSNKNEKFWMWIDTYYPYDEYYYKLNMEVCT